MKKTNLLRGLGTTTGFIFALSISLGIVANNNAGGINNFLGITAGSTNTSQTGDTHFASEFGELNDANLAKLLETEMKFCETETEEGSVLVKNNCALPLSSSERKISIFSRNSVNPVYRSTCGGPTANENKLVTFKKAFENNGFSVNDTLWSAYENDSTARVKAGDETSDIGEVPVSFYTNDIKSSFSKYNDVAVVVLTRWGGEGNDQSRKDVDGVRALELHPEEADMLKMIKESGFKKTVVLLNSIYPLELGFLDEDEYGIDAAMWIGNPGFYGLGGVVHLLTGDANPSGHFVDTYASNSLSSPAMQNFGEYYFTNGTGLDQMSNRYVTYAEGIYVGYKYYETRYADLIEGHGNANSTKGTYNSSGAWDYAKEVKYPFGYGLSYTSFQEEMESLSYDAETDKITVSVKVTNTGSVKGKTPIQLYVSVPYTRDGYDKEHGLEKSAIQLVDFSKTEILEPGASDSYTITFDRYLLASYDKTAHSNAGGYILEDGAYYFSVGSDAHDALNNVLGFKSDTGMVDQDGNAFVKKDYKTVIEYDVATFDDSTYEKSKTTGNTVKNLFQDADANYFYDNKVLTYVSRDDWDATWPTGTVLEATDKIKDALKTDVYATAAEDKTLSKDNYGVDAGIGFNDMIGKDYDDESWETFIKQLTLSDLGVVTSENYGQAKIDTINNKPQSNGEGPEGCSGTYLYGDKERCTGYASPVVLSCSYNKELQVRYGELFGEDGLYSGMNSVNGPGANLHRTPYGGRMSEYISEDGNMGYYVLGNLITGFNNKGMLGHIKHFFLNEQEYDRQGIATFANEQSIRELYLRSYEGAFTWGKAKSCMTSYNRIGCTYDASHSALQYDLTRGEWGFQGYFITDYIGECAYSVTKDMLINGNNMFGGNNRSSSVMQLISRNKDAKLLSKCQESAHRILWAWANSNYSNGFSATATFDDFVAWWQYALTGIEIGLGVISGGTILAYVYFEYLEKLFKKEKAA